MLTGLASVIPNLRQALDPKVEAAAVDKLSKDPAIKRKMADFAKAVAAAPDLATALKDRRVLAVLLPANGLGDQVDFPGLAQKALLSDPADTKSLANRLTDKRWLSAINSLGLKTKGLAALKDPSVVASLDKGLRSLQWRQGLDETTAGMSDALYFIQNAPNITNIYSVLGNSVLRRVVTTALNQPAELALAPIETQARVVQAGLPLADLKDASKVRKIAERYLTSANMDSTGSASSPLLSLFNNSSGPVSLNITNLSGINLRL